jgi:hypothetical protein
MARHKFGGGATDWVFSIDGTTSDAEPVASATILFFDALSGGSQITDLLDSTGVAATSIDTDSAGFLPEFQGPATSPDTRRMALDANSGAGPRYWVFATDTSAELDTMEAQIAAFGGGGTTTAAGEQSGDAIIRVGGPFYVYPSFFDTGGGAWAEFQKAAPYLSFVFVNADSGPGTSINTDFTTQIAEMKAAGMLVFGYVDTAFTTKDAATIVKPQIDDWFTWYGVDGIMFDEVTNDAPNLGYYTDLHDYVKAKTTGLRIVVINPGTVVDESYMTACDIVSNFEGDIGMYRAHANAGWEINYAADRFLHVVFGAYDSFKRDEAIVLAREYRAGNVYITDGTLPNPYGAVPGSVGGGKTPAPTDPNAYFEDLINEIASQPYPENIWAPDVEDDFQNFDGVNFSALWTVPVGSTATIASLALQLTATASGNDHLDSVSAFDFTGKRAEIEAVTTPSAASATTLMQLQVDANNSLAIGRAGTNLLMRSRSGGTNSDTTLTFSGTTHKWWKIVFSSGVAKWYTSPDGIAWTVRRTVNSGLPTLTAAKYVISAVRTADSNQTATFNNALVVGATADVTTPTDPDLLTHPEIAVVASMPRLRATAIPAAVVSGTLNLVAFGGAKGTPIGRAVALTGSTAKTGGTHGWYVILDSSRKVIFVTADQTDAATVWGATATFYPLDFTVPGVLPYDGPYYFGIMVAASGPPIFVAGASVAGGNPAGTGITNALTLAGASSTGLTTPPNIGDTMGAITTSQSQTPYFYVPLL